MISKEIIEEYIISAYNFQYYQRGCNIFDKNQRQSIDIETFISWKYGSENINWELFEEIDKSIKLKYKSGNWRWFEGFSDLYSNILK